MKRGVVNVEALFSADSKGTSEAFWCQVVEEDVLTLDVEGVGHYTLMWTPTVANTSAQGYTLEDGLLGEGEQPEGLALGEQPEGLALAMGFALSEGLITSLSDIKSLSVCPDDPKVVRVQLHHPETVNIGRKNVVINSSCGICGPREILEDNALLLPVAEDSLRLQRRMFVPLMEQMRAGQHIFEQTGGSHAAAIFDDTGNVLAVAEDLGRHNALDKAIGMAMSIIVVLSCPVASAWKWYSKPYAPACRLCWPSAHQPHSPFKWPTNSVSRCVALSVSSALPSIPTPSASEATPDAPTKA